MIDNTREEEQEEEQEIPVGVFVGKAQDLLRAMRAMDREDDVMEACFEYFENDNVEGNLLRRMNWSDEQEDVISTILRLVAGESAYIDGEAGTGKTTCIQEACDRVGNVLKCAPSGIAATNIGGRTFHKTFQLHGGFYFDRANWLSRRSTLLEEYGWKEVSTMMARALCKSRIEILNCSNAIWVDEAPMVRCDLIDEANVRLQHVMKNTLPFGGKRMIFSGDLGQLQPVVTTEDIPLLEAQGYESPFGFQQARVFNDS